MSRAIETRPARGAGFTLIELLVTMVVVALTLGAAVGLFNSMNKLSRVQLHTAEMQQSVRVAQREVGRLVQMAGRGGLAGENNVAAAFDTPAVSVRDNVGLVAPFLAREVAPGNAGSPLAVEGTDILTIRGAFDSSVFHINYADRTRFVYTPGTGGTIILGNRTPTGIPQDLRPIKWACDPPDDPGNARPEALVLVNAVNEESYAVVEIDCNGGTWAAIPDDFLPAADYLEYSVNFRSAADGGFTHADKYAELNPDGNNPPLDGNFNPSFLALLEEYRFYVREQCRTVDGAPLDECPEELGEPAELTDPVATHRLSMARMYPNTSEPHGGAAPNLRLDLADSIFDLQVALGFDSSHDENGNIDGFFSKDTNNTESDDIIYEAADGAADDWLFNGAGDVQAHFDALPWTPFFDGASWTFSETQPQPRLYYLRVTTVGFTARPDRGYQAPLIDRIENHDVSGVYLINGQAQRTHRRELLQTVIDMRNLG
jgi:prepilin-type N-terminal cleavage/methylation domain-containing protein